MQQAQSCIAVPYGGARRLGLRPTSATGILRPRFGRRSSAIGIAIALIHIGKSLCRWFDSALATRHPLNGIENPAINPIVGVFCVRSRDGGKKHSPKQ